VIRSTRRARAGIGVALLALAFVAGCRSKEDKIATHLARGEQYLGERKPNEALIEFRSALQLDPKSATANFWIAETFSAQQAWDSALFFYRETRRLDPSRTDAPLAEAGLLVGGQVDEAAKLVDEVLQQEPSNWAALSRKSEVLLAQNDLDGALAAAMTATELAPTEPVGYAAVGRAYQARLQMAQRAQASQKGEGPSDATYQSALAAFDKALALIDKASNGPNGPNAPGWTPQRAALLFERARVLGSWPGHTDEAVAAYRQLVELTQDSEDRKLALSAAIAAKRYARASKNLELEQWAIERQLAVAPERIGAWEQLAALVAQRGDSPDAIYLRMLEKLPASGEAHAAYAGYLGGSQKPDEAVAHLEKAVADGVEPAVTLTALADLYTQLGRFDDAKGVVDRLQREYPNEAGTIMATAQRALAEGRVEDAAVSLRQLAGKQESDQVQIRLAWVERALGREAAATAAVNRAIELHGGSWAVAERTRALLRASAKDWAGALASLKAAEQAGIVLDPSELVLAAQALYETGSAAQARQVLERVLALPNPPVGAVALFAQREGQRDPVRARELLVAAQKASPSDPTILGALTDLDVAARRAPEALARIDAAIEAGGAEAPAALYALRGRVKSVTGDVQGGYEDAVIAVVRAPDHREFLSVLVELAVASGKQDAAAAKLAELRGAGKLTPAGTEVLARLYTGLGRDTAAIPLYEELIAQPGLPEGSLAAVKNDLAYLLAKQGKDLDRALELAQEAQAGLAESVEVADTLGFVYLQKGLYEPALRQYDYAIELARSAKQPVASLYYHRGIALEKLGRPDDAAGSFEKSLAEGPGSPDAPAARAALAALKAAQSASR